MARRAGRRRSFLHGVNCDLELRPLMNVFIVLIPMLLMSAVFIEIRVIEMSLPRDAAVAAHEPREEPLDLSIRIGANAYVIEGHGVAARYISRPAGAGRDAVPGDAASAQIAQALAEIAAQHPDNHEIRIVAEATTRYQEIVALMDIARAAGLPQAALEGAESGGAS